MTTRRALANVLPTAMAVFGVAIAGCALVAEPPSARYVCNVGAPACPDGEVCVVGDGDEGVCGAVSVCVVAAGEGLARPAADGTTCPAPDGSTKAFGCSGGACVELACDTPGYPVRCGDDCVSPGEECEDGNVDDGDGCTRTCTFEPGWDCVPAPPRVRCSPRCGDGRLVGDEVCDDGNQNPADGCDETCARTTFAAAPLVSGSTDGTTVKTARFDLPLGIAADVEGVLFVADSRRHRILRFDPAAGDDGEAIVIAGNGTPGFSGDGGPALEAQLCLPVSVGVDTFGNVFVADALNHRVRRIDRDGVITTIAGRTDAGDECSFDTGSVDDDAAGPASRARFDTPLGLAVDRTSGAVYVVDTGNLRVRRLEPVGPRDRPTSWNVRTVVGRAGGYTSAFASAVTLASARDVAFNDGRDLGYSLGPTGIALGSDRTVYVVDTINLRIFRIPAACIDPNGGPCSITATPTVTRFDVLSIPFAVAAVAHDGGVDTVAYSDIGYESLVHAGRTVVDARTAISRAGVTGQPPLKTPGGVTSFGDALFFVDANEARVLRLPLAGGPVEEVAGRTGIRIEDGVAANDVDLFAPAQVAVDDAGALFTIEALGHVARRFAPAPDGRLVSTRVAGTGQLDMFALLGFNGAAPLTRPTRQQCGRLRDTLALGADASHGPEGLAVLPRVDAQGTPRQSVLVGDTLAQQVLRFDDDGTVCDVVSVLDVGGPGDEFSPRFLHREGRNLLIVDNGLDFFGAGRLVRVALRADGTPELPVQTLTLDGVDFIADALPLPDGAFLVADPAASVVWRYTPSFPLVRAPFVGVERAPADDGGDAPRGAARLFTPLGLARCPDGRILIADGGTGAGDAGDAPGGVGVRLRVLSADGTQVSTIAGTGQRGFAGDFGPARQARLDLPPPEAVTANPRTLLANSVGVACAADGTVYVAEHDGQRVRRIGPDGVITTVAGRTAPAGAGPGDAARLYAPITFAGGTTAAAPPSLIAVDGATGTGPDDGAGHVSVVDGGDDPVVRLAFGYPHAATGVGGPALRAPLLAGALGAAWDDENGHLVITQSGSTALRIVDVADADPAAWIDAGPVELGEEGLAGIAIDPVDGSFVVADEDDDCVRRLLPAQGATLALGPDAVAGTCGSSGGGLLAPTAVAFSPAGTLYISDTGHNRVVRVDDATGALLDVVGRAGAPSSAGEGAPAAAQAVEAPRQLAFDVWGNLYIASSKAVRVVLSDDGDDPDGDDRVVTAFGAGNGTYPERDARCITALAPLPRNLALPAGARGAVVVGDSCLGAAALLTVRSTP